MATLEFWKQSEQKHVPQETDASKKLECACVFFMFYVSDRRKERPPRDDAGALPASLFQYISLLTTARANPARASTCCRRKRITVSFRRRDRETCAAALRARRGTDFRWNLCAPRIFQEPWCVCVHTRDFFFFLEKSATTHKTNHSCRAYNRLVPSFKCRDSSNIEQRVAPPPLSFLSARRSSCYLVVAPQSKFNFTPRTAK